MSKMIFCQDRLGTNIGNAEGKEAFCVGVQMLCKGRLSGLKLDVGMAQAFGESALLLFPVCVCVVPEPVLLKSSGFFLPVMCLA